MSKRWQKISVIWGIVFVAIIGFVSWVITAERAIHKDTIIDDANVLGQLMLDWRNTKSSSIRLSSVSDWNGIAQLSNRTLTNLLANYRSYKPFIFTNMVQVNHTHYQCLFGIRDERFSKDEMLVASTNGVIIWITKNGNRILALEKNEQLIWIGNK